MHKIMAPLGFARTYPRLRRAKSGDFCFVELSAPPQFCNIRASKLYFACRYASKHAFAFRQTAMLVLKHNIKATGDVD